MGTSNVSWLTERFGRREVWSRHESLHTQPASQKPRIRPVTPIAPDQGPNIPAATQFSITTESQNLSPEDISISGTGWDFDLDQGVQDWLNEIFDGDVVDPGPSYSLPSVYQPPGQAPSPVDANYQSLQARMGERLRVSPKS